MGLARPPSPRRRPRQAHGARGRRLRSRSSGARP